MRPVSGSELMAATIPGAQLEVIADADHSPQFEAPDRWIEVLERFLAANCVPLPCDQRYGASEMAEVAALVERHIRPAGDGSSDGS